MATLRYILLLIAILVLAPSKAQDIGGASDKAQGVFDRAVRGNAPAQRSALYREIERSDSLLFSAFNAHDTALLKSWFTPDLEFHHDRNGSTDHTGVMKAFSQLFQEHPDIRRDPIKNSLEVHPIGEDGALQICQHRFTHSENGSSINAISRTIMLWRRTDEGWKVSRVFSFGH